MATKRNISEEIFNWLPAENESFKCRGCPSCLGKACIGELPGMGGVEKSANFLLNCSRWNDFYNSADSETRRSIDSIEVRPENIGIGPVTGANQNIGFKNEKDFYLPYFAAALANDFTICAGDGAPDEKLQFGFDAVEKLDSRAVFFLKPYPDEILEKRIEKVRERAFAIGMDIDAFNIITMRNQAHLERKSQAQLEWFRKTSGKPLALKGIFTEEDIALCSIIKPEIAVVSNHGGRVQTERGSSMDFLKKYQKALHECCEEVWVDGGIRTKRNIQTALFLGADKVLIARGFISRLIKKGVPGMIEYGKALLK